MKNNINKIIPPAGQDVSNLDHIAWSYVHGGFDPYAGMGGCSCAMCSFLRQKVQTIRKNEANAAYKSKYGI